MPVPSFISAPHKEALAFLLGKKLVASKVFYKLIPELRARAFAVSGLAGATALQRIRDAVAAVPRGPEGMTWDQAKREIADELEQAHFSEEAAETRANVILRVNTFQAWSASTYRVAMEDDDTTHLQYIHGDQAKVPTPSHLALDGIVLPKNDPFWKTHTGPWGHIGCVCYVRPMNPDLVEEERAKDATRAPEDRNVLEGAVRKHLNQGEIIRKGQRFNVAPPEDPMAFRWHPDDLRLPLDDVKARYDEDTWRAFEEWARSTLVGLKASVWGWLRGARL
ncbi:MAG TPA: phage minor head protein [Verrucomicrobiota bacterium]|nr:phage minor head protein [Verrucomicrobiota bacterium]HQL78692.1 phage minor head protein [Verrucomicrobiota bacterium]